MDTLLKSISPRTFIMAMVGVLLLIISALVSYGLWPRITEYRESLQTMKLLGEAVENADALDRDFKTIQKDLAMLETNMHGEMADLPDRQMEAYIIGRLQEVSWRHKVKLLGVRPSTVNSIASLVEIPFGVEVSGDYFDLYAWLKDLGEELRFLAITHFNISPVKSGDVTKELKANITLVAYREAENG